MKKTMIYLEEDQFVMLRKVAASSGKKVSEVIREALGFYLEEKAMKKDSVKYFSFVGIAEGPENGRASEEAEDVLKEALR